MVVLCIVFAMFCLFFFFKQKTAYEMRISDWSSDVCSSDLLAIGRCGSSHTPDLGHRQRPLRRDHVGQRLFDRLAFDMPACQARELPRSEERRVGKECVSTCRSRWSAYH